VRQPKKNLQIKFTRSLPEGNDFVAYVDAIGHLDGTHCLIEWKAASSRYPEEPQGLLMLDPQLVCYSWITPPSLKSSARNSAFWSTTPSDGSNRPGSCRTTASVFRRILVPVAPMSVCVWDNNNWSTPHWYAVRETTLVGLTNLISRNPPMPPKLNKKRALFVLTKIDEILAWERKREAEQDTRFVELGRYLCEVRAGQYWRRKILNRLTSSWNGGSQNREGRHTT
jgi:hypothetical protein